MVIHNLEQIRTSPDVMILPAYEIGKSQLINLIQGLHDHVLLHKVILIAPPETIQDLPITPPFYIQDKSESVPELISKIEQISKENHLNPQSVMAVDEEMQYQMSARIAHHFSLPFFDDKTCRVASVKYLSKKMFRAFQIPTGSFELISAVSPEIATRIGFPSVLKPLAGTQSQFIFPNYNYDELAAHFSILSAAAKHMGQDPRFTIKTEGPLQEGLTLNPKSQFLLESMIPGEEMSCDFMIQGERLDIIRVVKKIPAGTFGMFRGYALLSEQDLKQNGIDMLQLREVCHRIAAGFGINRGICMVDFKINEEGLFVLESSIRPGLSAFNHLMFVKYGYTSPLLLSLLNMGARIDLQFPQSSGLVVFLYAPKTGYLTEMDFSELIRRKDEFNLITIHRFSNHACQVVDSDVDHTDLIQGYVLIDRPSSSWDTELADRISACVVYKWRDTDDLPS